ALVRSRVRFELDGLAVPDPSWQYTFTPQPNVLASFEFAIELGNVAQLEDGLIGYFVGDTYTTFNDVQESGAVETAHQHRTGAGGGNGGTTTCLLPRPDEKAGTWAWVEKDAGGWTTYPTAPNNATARLGEVPPVLRRGLLQLSAALGKARRT